MKTSQKLDVFYQQLKELQNKTGKTKSKTISTQEFKQETEAIYEKWMVETRPILIELKIGKDALTLLDSSFADIHCWTNLRVTEVSLFKGVLGKIVETFFKEVILNLKQIEPLEPTANLMDSVSFLGLDTNWSVATCALQLQEVSIKVVAEKAKIDLSKTNVEKLLNVKIPLSDFSFNHQYEAFGKEVKRFFNVDMPFLTIQFRRMRVKVLHEGYNPQPEEKEAIVSFTIGLMKKLDDVFKRVI